MVGNPLVWWGSSVLFFGVLIQLVLMRPLGTKLQPPVRANRASGCRSPASGCRFCPLLGVTRVLFLYHYLTPLLFSLAFVLLWLDRSGWWSRGGPAAHGLYGNHRGRGDRVSGISPLTYGFSVGGLRRWLPASSEVAMIET
jgi:hypothetical protein